MITKYPAQSQLINVKSAFTRKAQVYDAYSLKNKIVQLGRRTVYHHILGQLCKNDKILELNSGTGMDALFFAKKGFQIHATDISEGMLDKIGEKIRTSQLKNFTYQKLALQNLTQVDHAPFDYIFSNFGGLNCLPKYSLKQLAKEINPSLLRPEGFLTMVIMPPICPWELLNFPWNVKAAFRRIPSLWGRATRSHINGIYFNSYYYSVGVIEDIFSPEFKKVSLQSISLFSPPSFMDYFPSRYPKLFSFLINLDNRFSTSFPFNSYGDYFVITLQYLP